MQREVISVSPELTLREVVEVFSEHGVSGAPVVAGGKVLGVISTTDILDFREDVPEIAARRDSPQDEGEGALRRGFATSEYFSEAWDPVEVDALEWMRTARSREWDLLDEYTAADIMTREVISQPSETSVREAARYLLDVGIHRVLVIDNGQLQGIVTTTDIVRAVADGLFQG
jgi:CBS domain-containing protein